MNFIRSSNTWRVFMHAPGAKPWSVLVCIMVAGILDMMTMGMILPLIGTFGDEGIASDSTLSKIVEAIVTFLGIAPELKNYLLLATFTLTGKSLMALAALAYVAHSVSVVQASIRQNLLKAVMQARWSYFVDLPPGQVTNSVTGQALFAGEAYYSTSVVIVSTIQALALTFAASLVSGPVVLVTGVVAVIVSFPLYRLIKLARESGAKQWERQGEMGARAQDVIGNMKAIKSMNQGGVFWPMFLDMIEQMRKAYFLVVLSRHSLSHGQDAIIAITVAGGVYVGTQIFSMALADIMVLGFIYAQIITYVKKIQEQAQQAAIMQPAYFMLLEQTKEADSNREEPSGSVKLDRWDICEFQDVNFSYGAPQILHDINLSVESGKISVLLGPSGAGKTTIIDLLTGLLRPSSGRIVIDGVPMEEIDLEYWRSNIGYVPQELTLLHGTVFDNVTLRDPNASREEVWEALEKSGAHEFISKLPEQLDTHIGTMGSKLSGGERQRLSLARALIKKPKLLILDEVTSSLDEDTEAAICDNIGDLEGDFAIIAITHRPAWKDIATHLYRVEAGRCTRMEGQPAGPL